MKFPLNSNELSNWSWSKQDEESTYAYLLVEIFEVIAS